jgi:hypothetical protein
MQGVVQLVFLCIGYIAISLLLHHPVTARRMVEKQTLATPTCS